MHLDQLYAHQVARFSSPKNAAGCSQSSLDCAAMTEHATLLLNSIIQKYHRSQGCNIREVVILRTAGDEYWQASICRFELDRNFNNLAGLTRPETWLDQVD